MRRFDREVGSRAPLYTEVGGFRPGRLAPPIGPDRPFGGEEQGEDENNIQLASPCASAAEKHKDTQARSKSKAVVTTTQTTRRHTGREGGQHEMQHSRDPHNRGNGQLRDAPKK